MNILIPKELITYFAIVCAGIEWTLSEPPATIKAIILRLTDSWYMGNQHINVCKANLSSTWLLLHDQALSLPPSLGKKSLDAYTSCLSLHLTTLIQSIFIDRVYSWHRISLLCRMEPSAVWMVSWVQSFMWGFVASVLPSHVSNFLSRDCSWLDPSICPNVCNKIHRGYRPIEKPCKHTVHLHETR